MIAKEDYRQKKEVVLALYQEKFMPLVYEACSVTGDKTIAETRLKNLAVQAEKIKADKFTLMIAGEAKSGKSTFINAYLGVEVLPMDDLQCTSCIVEIKYASELVLTATYTDGKKTVLRDEEAIRVFLKENGAMDDRYRGIPVPIINDEIIAKKKGKMPSGKEIDFLMAGIAKDKPSGMTDEVYRARVIEYIEAKRSDWNLIISKIEIGYPFKDKEMRGITIVDSPGVGSEGHVGDVTYNYIKNVDAIIFLKTVFQDIDSSSFKEFINLREIKKKKDVLFLTLTYITGKPEADLTRIYHAAIERFKENIQEEQILTVDSKAQVIFNQIKEFSLEDINDWITRQKKAKALDNFVKAAWFDADEERDAFLEELQALSRFKSVHEALNRFARKAHYAQLRDFLSSILRASKQIAGILGESVDFYTKGLIAPDKLEEEINTINEELNKTQAKLNETLDVIKQEYNGKEGRILNESDEVVALYKAGIEKIDSSGGKAGRFQALENLTFEQTDKFGKFREQIRTEVIARCDKELVILNDKGSIKADVIKPEITLEMIEEAKEEEKENSYTSHDVEEGVTLLKTKKKVPVFSEDLHYENVKENIQERIEDIKSKLSVSLIRYVDAVCEAYRKELKKNIEDQKVRLEKVKNDKRDNEARRATIEQLKGVIKRLDSVDALVKAEKEGVEQYVSR